MQSGVLVPFIKLTLGTNWIQISLSHYQHLYALEIYKETNTSLHNMENDALLL